MALLDVAKRQLGYLNADAQTELLLQDLLDEGRSFLTTFDPDCDFESPSLERSLLIDFVRYALSNARDDFSKNYRDLLIKLSNRGKVKAYAGGKEE